MASLPDYAELHCVSNFSFLRGASHAEELVARAKALGYAALAITDECSLAGIVRAHVAAKEHGLKLLVGSELEFSNGLKLVLLASDREGYGNLCELITLGRRRAKKGGYRLSRDDLEQGLPGCLALVLRADRENAIWIKQRFPGRAWIAAELHRGPRDAARLAELRALGEASGLPLVAAGDVHMHARARRPLQDTLTAIRLGTTVAGAGHALFPNAERHLRRRLRLAQLYPDELLAETLRVAERCAFSLDELRYEYPEELVPEGFTPSGFLRKLTEEGIAGRFPGGCPAGVRALIEHELALIAELGYEPFFLTVHDIVRFARGKEILCQGRGSAANSVVCYCLGITEVHPEQIQVLFERFVSHERNEPPDIDVDFEHQRREEVIQYVYGKYGRARTAIAATVIRYRGRSAARDVARALGADHPRAAALAAALEGFPRHLSQHVGGFVIARGRLSRLVPIENAAMPGRSVIEWDKDDLDAVGLLKVDVLALGMLTALRRALDALGLRVQDVPREDPAVYAMLQQADTVGVFQVESRAQMSMLPRLKPASFYDLVIQIAIVRPGPIQGDMVHPYLRRRDGLEAPDYPPALEGVLRRTLGIPIFQEQVMQIAVAAADFTPGEADRLRRSMGKWQRGGDLGPFQAKFLSGMDRNGYSREFAARVWKQIEGFGEYGFPESHAASFALIAYVSAWLKRHHPAEFLAALLNSQPMGFYQPSQLVQDARRHGVEVRAVDVAASDWESTLENGSVRLGFHMISGFLRSKAEQIVNARAANPFKTVEDLARRLPLDRRDLRLLAGAGALASLAGHRRNAHWRAAGVVHGAPLARAAPPEEATPPLRTPTEGEDIVADYASLGLTLGRHPLTLLRGVLRKMNSLTAEELAQLPHGSAARASGIVVSRQQPGTAGGTIFVTLEDETGSVNVIVWPRLSERQPRELLESRLMTVHGTLEREGAVMHLIAKRLVDDTRLLGRLTTSSRDFH